VAERLEKTSKAVGEGVTVMAIVSGVILLALMALTFVAVTLRKFNNPILGTQDLSEAGLIVVVFFALAYSGWTGGHIAVDLISGVLKGRGLRIVDTAVRLSCGVFFLIVAWQSLRQGLDVLEYGDGFNLLPIPHFPFYFIIAFGSAVYALVLFVLGLRSAQGLPEPERP
jgi:TRAP-type C4-dicarboxylate transport system permease small subunit